jgi:hypothetical protein
MRKPMMILTILGLTLASLVTATSIARAQTDTKGKATQSDTGKVTLSSTSVAAGVGVSWGDGRLEYYGKKYPFSVKGLDVLNVGVSKVTAKGTVSNLKKLEDFDGNYVLSSAGAAVGGGAGAAALKNQNGVGMTLTGTSKGLKFSVAQGGVEVKLKQQ